MECRQGGRPPYEERCEWYEVIREKANEYLPKNTDPHEYKCLSIKMLYGRWRDLCACDECLIRNVMDHFG